MTDAKRLGLVTYDKSLCVFVADLRSCVHKSQSELAKHFGLSHATISRYENNQLRPPPGYLASLVQLYVTWVAARGQPEEDCRRAMLTEVGEATRGFYPYDPPIRTWDELRRVADDYMAKRRLPKDPKALPPEPAQVADRLPETVVSAAAQDLTPKLNPFVHGRPITDPARFIGRQQQTREVLSRLTNLDSSSVVGERRIGKTSFLRYVSHPDVIRRFGLDPRQYLFAFVSLREDKRQETQRSFWYAAVDELSKNLQDEGVHEIINKAKAADDFGSDEMTALVDAIGRQGYRVVLLLDEFEQIAGNPNFDLSFFNNLRSLAQHHPLVLITASRRELIDLCHSKEIQSSPFFNIFTAVDMGLFSPHEADELIDRGLDGTSVTFQATEKARMKDVTGRHPLFLQMACHYLFQACQEDKAEEGRWRFVLERLYRQSAAHFRDYWDHCSLDERIVLTAAAMLEGIEDKDALDVKQMRTLRSHPSKALDQLKRRGLLIESEEYYAVFSPLFADWIISEVCDPTAEPDQEFANWLAVLRGDPELGKTLKNADKDGTVIKTLSKVKPQYRDMIRRWLHNEGTSNVTRILLAGVEVVRLVSHLLGF